MTVGVPEISLDTWGLKYVKKKGASPSIQAGNLAHDTPSQKIEEEVSSHGGRQSDSVKDPKGQKITHPAETDPQRIEQGVGRSTTQTTTGRREGATSTIGSKESEQEKHGQKHLTSEGKILEGQGNPKRPLGVGESASHESGIKSPETQTGRTAQGKPSKTGKEGKTHGALPKVKAEMELAIIKCKLLKMNNVNKILPAIAAGVGRAVSGVASGIGNAAGNAVAGKLSDKPDEEVEKSEEQKKITDKRNPDEKIDDETKKFPMYKSDDIVDKAIELINEAYDSIKSESFKKLKPVYEGDTKEAKKVDADQGQDLSGTKVEEDRAKKDKEIGDLAREKQKDAPASTGDVGAANFVYSDVKEKKKQEEDNDTAEQQAEEEEMEADAWHSQND